MKLWTALCAAGLLAGLSFTASPTSAAGLPNLPQVSAAHAQYAYVVVRRRVVVRPVVRRRVVVVRRPVVVRRRAVIVR
jgi:hypothetical protein